MLSLQGIMTRRYVTEEVRAMIVEMRIVGLKLSEIALIVERMFLQFLESSVATMNMVVLNFQKGLEDLRSY